MKINEINYFIKSLTGWNTLYVSNIGTSMTVLKTLKIISCLYARNMLNIMTLCRMWNVIVYGCHIYYIFIFYHVADEMIELWKMTLPVGFLLLQYSVLFTVESLSLLHLLVISWFISSGRWYIDKLGVFHTNQIVLIHIWIKGDVGAMKLV